MRAHSGPYVWARRNARAAYELMVGSDMRPLNCQLLRKEDVGALTRRALKEVRRILVAGTSEASCWWARLDLNQEPTDYESAALTVELRAQ